MQKISDAALAECPKCAGKLEKQWSLSGFQFKGSGWYVSDYTDRGKEPKSDGKSAESGEIKSADSSAANSESSSSQTNSESSAKSETSDAPKTSAGSESTASAPAASKSEVKPAKAD